jgi:hypothetical protein
VNARRARAVRRSYGVKHVRQAQLRRGEERFFPRWLSNAFEVRRRIENGTL